MENNKNLVELEDFVICKICNFHAQNLGIHLRKIHNIDPKDYDGDTTSKKSHQKYSENHFSFLTFAKNSNIDLTEYSNKMSEAVSKSILDNPQERERRSKLMGEINQTDHMRQKSSDAAIKTSARPEILESRTKQLEKWRKEHPEDFYEKCIKPMITAWQSKPEKLLFEFASSISDYHFERNVFIKSNSFTSLSKRRQMDIVDKQKRIYIEFDGIIHFDDIFGEDILKRNNVKDIEVENYISKHNWILIRVSYDQFIYKTKMINKIKQDKSYFKQECLDKLLEILNNKIPGVYKIGEAYGQH
jgi:hypothetical protein